MAEKKKKRKKHGKITKAKKKYAVARAVYRKGSGKIKINKKPISIIDPQYVRGFIAEPLKIAGNFAKEIDIDVTVKGGGFMSQAVAARSAIAKALVANSPATSKLREGFLGYDRLLLVDDVRRVESKKPLGTKARKKKQKSKR